jgi:hypothetical protein
VAARAFLRLPQDAPELLDPVELGRRPALRAVAETAWKQLLGSLHDDEQVQSVLGLPSRQEVQDLAERGQLLALEASRGRKLYPAFQLDDEGKPYTELPQVLKIFSGVVQTPYTVASWFVSPQDILNGDTPAAWMKARRDPERLFEAARCAAWELAQ